MSDRPSHNPQGHKSQLRRIIDEVNSYGFYPTSGSERMDACASGTPLQVPTPRFTLNGEVQRRPSAVSWMVEESTELMTKQVSSAEHYGYSGFVPCAVMGDSWRKIRKTINPSFRTNVLSSFGASFSYHTKTFIEKLNEFADGEKMVDLFAPVHLCTIDFVCENMMGCRMEIQKRNMVFLSTNLEKSSEMIHTRIFNFLLQPDLIYTLLGKKKALQRLVQGMRDLAKEMIELRAKYREETRLSNTNSEIVPIFMENLLNSVESGVISNERAVDETVEMFIAGSITTATTAAWILKIFAQRPEIQERAYKEIVEISNGLEITLEDVSKLTYLEMVVKETLRHFGIPFVGRALVEDLQVDEKMTIPAGVSVMPILFVLHHDPAFWEKPNEFYPDHFSQINEQKRPKGVFVPFLNGPRHCPGNKYAYQSVKYLIANTLLHYEFSSDEKAPDDIQNANYRILFMVWPLTGFRAKIRRRTNSPSNPQAG
nr:PREDICTED: cytochrome P450 4C1-like [Bemisia tabaci]